MSLLFTAMWGSHPLIAGALEFPDHLPGATLPGPLFSMISPFEIGEFAQFGVPYARLFLHARAGKSPEFRVARAPIFYTRARENRPNFARIFPILG